MKPLERLINRVTFRNGIIVCATMVVLALSSTSARRVVRAVMAASVGGAPSATVAAAAENSTVIRPFQFHAPDEALADLRRRIAATNIFGAAKNPCRLVYGVASLPLGAAVELEVSFEVTTQNS